MKKKKRKKKKFRGVHFEGVDFLVIVPKQIDKREVQCFMAYLYALRDTGYPGFPYVNQIIRDHENGKENIVVDWRLYKKLKFIADL